MSAARAPQEDAMKHRHVFLAPDLQQAYAAIDAMRQGGVADDDISLVARSDIEIDRIPNRRKEADTDFMPAALRGVLFGGLLGAVVGTVAIFVAPAHFNWAGVAVMAICGALVGAWASSLVGSALPDPVRRQFKREIEAGRILLVLDAEDALERQVEQRLEASGVTPLGRVEMQAGG